MMSIVVRAVAVGLLIEGAGWVNTASPDLPWRADWCDCTDWSEAESRCFASRTVIEWPCGVPVHLRILLLPESELAPMRPEMKLPVMKPMGKAKNHRPILAASAPRCSAARNDAAVAWV